MLGNLALDLLIAVLLMTGWYLCLRYANRRRMLTVLRWIHAACRGTGSIAAVRWHTASRCEVDLHLCPEIFRRASLDIQLYQREMPVYWLMSVLRHAEETVTFKAELDARPRLILYVQNQRWCARTGNKRAPADNWEFHTLAPVAISSRPEWDQDMLNMVEALLASRSCDFMSLSFRRKSPHIVACAPLKSLAPEMQGGQIFAALRELAATASTSAH